jgi:hypothetical protein
MTPDNAVKFDKVPTAVCERAQALGAAPKVPFQFGVIQP